MNCNTNKNSEISPRPTIVRKAKQTLKKDPTWTLEKVTETQKELIDTEGFGWLESIELAIDKRKFLLNRLYQKQPIPQDED